MNVSKVSCPNCTISVEKAAPDWEKRVENNAYVGCDHCNFIAPAAWWSEMESTPKDVRPLCDPKVVGKYAWRQYSMTRDDALNYLNNFVGDQPYPRYVVRHTRSKSPENDTRTVEVLTLIESPNAEPGHFRMLTEHSFKYYYDNCDDIAVVGPYTLEVLVKIQAKLRSISPLELAIQDEFGALEWWRPDLTLIQDFESALSGASANNIDHLVNGGDAKGNFVMVPAHTSMMSWRDLTFYLLIHDKLNWRVFQVKRDAWLHDKQCFYRFVECTTNENVVGLVGQDRSPLGIAAALAQRLSVRLQCPGASRTQRGDDAYIINHKNFYPQTSSRREIEQSLRDRPWLEFAVRASDVAGVYKLAVISSSGEATDASSLTVVHGWARRDDVAWRCRAFDHANPKGLQSAPSPQTSSKLLQTNETTPKLSTSSSIQALKSNTQSVRVSPRMERRVEPSAIRSLPDDDDDDDEKTHSVSSPEQIKNLRTAQPSLAELQIKKRPVSAASSTLLLAASAGDTNTVRKVLQIGADIEARDAAGRTPLLAAAASGFADTCRVLLENGADVGARTSGGASVLHCLVGAHTRSQDKDIRRLVKTLCRQWGSTLVGDVDASGETALHRAAAGGRADVVAELIAAAPGCVHLPSHDGMLPVVLAVRCNKKSIVKLLLEHGAQTFYMVDSQRVELSEVARRLGHHKLADWLSAGKIAQGSRVAGTKDKSKLARMRERLLKPTSASPSPSSSSLPSCQRCTQTLRKSQHSTGVCDACARLSSGTSSRQRAVRRVASFVTARNISLGGNPWQDAMALPSTPHDVFAKNRDLAETTLGPATTKNKRASIALSRTQLALADLARHDDDVKTDDAVNAAIARVLPSAAAAVLSGQKGVVVLERGLCESALSVCPPGTYAFVIDVETQDPLLFWVASSRALPVIGSTLIALHDFEGDPKHDLIFSKGDRIVFDGASRADGFWTGHIGDKRGMFPANAVKRTEQTNVASENDRPSVLHAELTFNGEGVLLEGNRHKFETLNDFLKTYSEILTTPWCPSWTEDITIARAKLVLNVRLARARMMVGERSMAAEQFKELLSDRNALEAVARIPTILYWRAVCLALGEGKVLSRSHKPTPTVKSQRLAAIEVLGDAIKSLLPESSAELFNYRALVLASVEELPAAVKDMQRALELNPLDSILQENLVALSESVRKSSVVEVSPPALDGLTQSSSSTVDPPSPTDPSPLTTAANRRPSLRVPSSRSSNNSILTQAKTMADNLKQMSVDEAARLIHSAAKKMQKENYSSTSVNKMLCLLHALWLYDERTMDNKADSGVLYPVLCQKLTEKDLQRFGNAQILRFLLVWLPTAGENAIDDMISRLHHASDISGEQFEQAFDVAVDLMTDEEINAIFKSLKVADIQWFLSFYDKRSAGARRALARVASSRWAVEKKHGTDTLYDRRTSRVMPLTPPTSTNSSAISFSADISEAEHSSATFLAAWLDANRSESTTASTNEVVGAKSYNDVPSYAQVPEEKSTPTYNDIPPSIDDSATATTNVIAGDGYHRIPAEVQSIDNVRASFGYNSIPDDDDAPRRASSNSKSQKTEYTGMPRFASEASLELSLSELDLKREKFAVTPSDDAFAYTIASSELIRRRKIGEGAYGVVYCGRWRHIDVAIKEIKFESPEQLNSFKSEAHKMQALRPHAHIVQFYGVCLEPRFAIVTKYCAGGALDRRLYGPAADRNTPLSAALAHNLARGVAFGVAHLHREGIVHGDIAARNVLLGPTLEALVCDFGLSHTGTGVNIESEKKLREGPLAWMAPEQLHRRARCSTQSDVYSYGVLLYEVAARRRPWDTVSPEEAVERKRKGESLPPPPGVDSVLVDLMANCQQFDVSKRPTMDDIASVLTRSADPRQYSDAERAWLNDTQTPFANPSTQFKSADTSADEDKSSSDSTPSIVVDTVASPPATPDDTIEHSDASSFDESSSSSSELPRFTRTSSLSPRRSRSPRSKSSRDTDYDDDSVGESVEEDVTEEDEASDFTSLNTSKSGRKRHLAKAEDTLQQFTLDMNNINQERGPDKQYRYLRCLPQKDIVEQSRCPPRWHMRAPRTTAVDSTENEIEIVVGTSMPLSVVVNNDKLTLDDVSFNVVDDANRKRLKQGKGWFIDATRTIETVDKTKTFIFFISLRKVPKLVKSVRLVCNVEDAFRSIRIGLLSRAVWMPSRQATLPKITLSSRNTTNNTSMSDDDDDDQPVPKRTPSKLRRVRSRSPRSKDVPLKHSDSLEKLPQSLAETRKDSSLRAVGQAAAAIAIPSNITPKPTKTSSRLISKTASDVKIVGSVKRKTRRTDSVSRHKCRACGSKFGEKDIALHIGAWHYHSTCFVCQKCNEKVDLTTFKPTDTGQVFCENCRVKSQDEQK